MSRPGSPMNRRVAAACAVLALAGLGAAPAHPDPVDKAVGQIVKSPAFKAAVADLDRNHDRMVQEIVTLTEIPAPPYKEAAKGRAYAAMLKAAGLTCTVEAAPEQPRQVSANGATTFVHAASD